MRDVLDRRVWPISEDEARTGVCPAAGVQAVLVALVYNPRGTGRQKSQSTGHGNSGLCWEPHSDRCGGRSRGD